MHTDFFWQFKSLVLLIVWWFRVTFNKNPPIHYLNKLEYGDMPISYQLKTPAKVSWAFKMVSQGSIYTWSLHAFFLIGYIFDLLKTFPFTLGHINVSSQNGYKSVLQFLCHMQNLTAFTSMKAIDMRCILFIISWFQFQRPQQERAWHQHWKIGRLTTFNEDDCCLSVCNLLSVSFAQFGASACWRDTQLLIRGDACCISTVISDYNMPYSL